MLPKEVRHHEKWGTIRSEALGEATIPWAHDNKQCSNQKYTALCMLLHNSEEALELQEELF